MKKKYLFILLTVLTVGFFLLFSWHSQKLPTGEIPKEYQALYVELEQKLKEFDQRLDAEWDGQKSDVIFATDLVAANGNRGTALLDEKGYQYILLYLDRFQELGVKGVKISLNYPLLVSDFPNSDRYLEFYEKLSAEIREKRKLKLLIQPTAVFPQAEFSDTNLEVKDYYRKLTLQTYTQSKIEHIQKILDKVRPDYLFVETEPDTMAHNTGLNELNDHKTYKQVVEEQLRGLRRDQTLLGAGVGTWNSQEFVEGLVTIPDLDFLELRIYPIDFFGNALSYIDMAKSHDKKVIYGESWLYKISKAELEKGEGAAWAKILSRDVFEFWQPLDQKFLELFVKLARYKGVEFISPFWSNYFFTYLDYDFRTKNAEPGTLLKSAAKEAFKNVKMGKFSQTGLKYQELISE